MFSHDDTSLFDNYISLLNKYIFDNNSIFNQGYFEWQTNDSKGPLLSNISNYDWKFDEKAKNESKEINYEFV